MKIFISNIGTEVGGIESSLIAFLKYISQKDVQIDLLLWKANGPLFKRIPPKVNVLPSVTPGNLTDIVKRRIHYLPWYIICKLLGKIGCAWKGFKKQKKEYDIAISYCQNGYAPYYTIDKVSAKRKYVYYHHGSYEKKGKEKKRDEKYYSKYDGIIAPSESCAEMLACEFPVLANKILVIPNIIEIEEIIEKAKHKKDAEFPKDKKSIVTVSRLSYEKGIDISIETAKCLADAGVDFVWYFIGDGSYEVEAEQMIKANTLEDKCILLGRKTNPFPYMQAADLIVQTSRVEAHPVAVMEAIALKKPIIASDISAIDAVLKKYGCGITCELNAKVFAYEIQEYIYGRLSIKTAECGESLNQETFGKIDELLKT